ncbi:MAG: hypothetical protein J0M11_04980 [Anaerolineae bacterium]|nr:hypothetical protein [Anaerolineae bacterium]
MSGPLLDRIDIHIEVPRVDYKKLSRNKLGETSEIIRKRVQTARDIQTKRYSSIRTSNIESSTSSSKGNIPKTRDARSPSRANFWHLFYIAYAVCIFLRLTNFTPK